jgi:hypothetical protein
MDDTYGKLIALLDRNGAAYRLIDHPPEGQTDLLIPQHHTGPGIILVDIEIGSMPRSGFNTDRTEDGRGFHGTRMQRNHAGLRVILQELP